MELERRKLRDFPLFYSLEPPKSHLHEYLVIDLETGGFHAEKSPITEVGCIRVKNRHVVDHYSALVKTSLPTSEKSLALSGLTEEMLEQAKPLEVVADELSAFIGKKPLTLFAHNALFDMRFLFCSGLAQAIQANCPIADSLRLARHAYPGLKSYKLQDLAKELNLKQFNPHWALADAVVTAQLIESCYMQLDTEYRLSHINNSELPLIFECPPCPRCQSYLTVKDGFTQTGRQTYRCKDCQKKFSDTTGTGNNRASRAPTLDELRAKHPEGLIVCKHCESPDLVIKEHHGDRTRYRCKSCGHTMTVRVE